MTETKRDRFVRIVESRTNKILDMLRLLANCSNKSNYEYSDDDVKQIFSAIEKEVKTTKNAFLGIESIEERFVLKPKKKTERGVKSNGQ
jgi:hypothetical protein